MWPVLDKGIADTFVSPGITVSARCGQFQQTGLPSHSRYRAEAIMGRNVDESSALLIQTCSVERAPRDCEHRQNGSVRNKPRGAVRRML